MRLEYIVEPQDVAQGTWLFLRAQRFHKWGGRLLRFVLGPSFLVLGLFALYSVGFDIWPAQLVVLGAFLVFGGGLYRWAIDRLFTLPTARSTPAAIGRKVLRTDESGITESSEHGQTTLSWSAISRTENTATHLILFSGAQFIVVPKARVQEGDPEQLASELHARLDTRAA